MKILFLPRVLNGAIGTISTMLLFATFSTANAQIQSSSGFGTYKDAYMQVFASISSDIDLNIDSWGEATSNIDPARGYTELMFSVSENGMTIHTGIDTDSNDATDGVALTGSPNTTYSATAQGLICLRLTYGTECNIAAATTASLTTGNRIGGGSGGDTGGTPNSPPIIDSMSTNRGDIGDNNVPIAILGQNMNPGGSGSVGTYTPSLSFSPVAIGNSEIDGTYSISCTAQAELTAFTVTTPYGTAIGPDFVINTPYLGNVEVPDWQLLSVSSHPTVQLFVDVYPLPSVCPYSSLQWTISDPTLATLVRNGNGQLATLTALKAGTVIVTVSYAFGGNFLSEPIYLTINP